MGHAERSCAIGLRIADVAGYDPELRSSLFYALLLKDAGCSATSATTTAVLRCERGADVARLAVEHHERLDGSGYPRGLSAAQLSLPSRILQVADVAEALSADRPYRASLSADEVLAIMRADAGTRIDARVFEALAAWLPHRGELALAA